MTESCDRMVRLHFSGKMGPNGTRIFQRPIPYTQASMNTGNPLVVDETRHCEATEEEAAYLLGLGGAFTKAEPVKKPDMPEVKEAKPPAGELDDIDVLPEAPTAAIETPAPVDRPRKGGRFVKKGDI